MAIDVQKLSSFLVNRRKEEQKKQAQSTGASLQQALASRQETVTPSQNNDTWFKAGAFDDGWQIEDLVKTILGTTGDIGVNALKGAGSLVEGVTDLLGYAGAGVADLFGADEFADDWRKSIQKNTVDAILQPAETFVDQASILGGKSDSISQGLGQVAAIILTGGAGQAAGLGSTGVTALTTGVTGLSGMGSGMSQAYQEGATGGEAVAYGAIAGAAEALTELLFSGMGKSINALGFSKGLSSADDMLAKKLSSKISSQLGKNLVELGVKAGAEGTEEVLSGIAQAFGKKLTYKSQEEIGQLIKDERLLEQFLTGAITSGIAQSGIVPGMKSGSLIEATKAGNLVIKDKNKASQMLTTIGIQPSEVSSIVSLAKGSLTQSSPSVNSEFTDDADYQQRYNKYSVELSKYSPKERAVYKRHMDSGMINNRQASHDFVDLLVKLEQDTGITIDLTNNDALKSSGFSVDGRIINGVKTQKGILINVNGEKQLNSVVGHEIAHVLESQDPALYETLQRAIVQYAKSKGEYQKRLTEIVKTYENVKDADIDAELVADLVGDYLFTDADFIKHLSTENRNLFQKIYDEIKYLYKVATAGTKEARQLEKVKKAFADAYRAETKNPTKDGGTRYSLRVKRTTGEEILVNPATITRREILDYMDMSYRRKLEDNSYFPVSAHTPETIIATLRNYGIDILDKPLAMQAKKARQAQNDQDIHTKDGYTIRGHAMSAEEVIETIDKLETPEAIIQETARTKTVINNEGFKEKVNLSDAYVVFVTLDSGKECVAVIEFDSYINVDYIVPDGNGDEYHTTITVFEPDVMRKGVPYDYFEYLNSKQSNRVLEIAEESPNSKTANGENLATVSVKGLSNEMLTQPGAGVKQQFSLSSSENVKAVEQHFGTTYKISEAGYLLTDGNLLDFSGRHEGAPGGYRTVDHRDITDALDEDYGGDNYSDGMIRFMGEGNIRLSPESGGINLSVKPNKEQLSTLDRYISNFRGEVILDIDDANGNTVVSIEYPKRTYSKRIINDINAYFDEGKIPEQPSDLGQFRYSLSKKDFSIAPPVGADVYGKDIGYDIAPPIPESVLRANKARPKVGDPAYAPIAEKYLPKVKPEDSTGAAPSGFDPVSHLQYEYGSLPEGEKPVREDSLPKSTNGKDKVSLTARTVKGAEATPDALVDLLDKTVVEGGLSYIPLSNDATVQKAYDRIKNLGWEEALVDWKADVRAGKVSAELSATGALLLNNAANAGDRAVWLDVLHEYQRMGTSAAQAVQALRILKTLVPEDKLYMIHKSVDQMNRDSGYDVEVDEDLLHEWDEAETDVERDEVLDAIMQNVADQIPASFMEKFTALRYVNMLGNLRTQVRNVAGNLSMKGVRSIHNTIATGLEAIVNMASGGKTGRTRAVTVSKEQKVAAKQDFEKLKSVILDGGKYSDSVDASTEFAKGVQEKRKIFKFKPLEGYRKATNWAMEQGDLIFARDAYARALAGYLKANSVTETDYSQIDTKVLEDARLFAIKEAQEATFRDTNALSGWISRIGRRKDTHKVGKLISEGVMPFRKTPANVLIRAEEYSPLGVINSVYYSVKAMQKESDVTATQVINSWAKSLTGTGLFALGMVLQSLGCLAGGADDDESKDKFDSMNGWQNYAIVLPDGTNLTIDFLTPTAMPMLMGAELNQLMADDGFALKDLESALTSITEPMVQMSMLQGINDTLDNVKYSDNSLMQMAINSGLSYVTQGITNTLLGQVERAFEDSRTTTYVDKDSAIPDWLQRTIGKVSAKMPGLDYNQIPYINAWGEEEEYGNVASNLAYNMLSPSYVDKGKEDAVSKELLRLNEVQSENVFPNTPAKSLSFTDVNNETHKNYQLSAEEYVALAKTQGQKQRELVEAAIATMEYGLLSDTEKATVIKNIYKYAKEYARGEVIEGYADDYGCFSSKWMSEIYGDVAEEIIWHTIDQRD